MPHAPAPESLIDLERYPVNDLASPAARAAIAAGRKSLAERGAAILPGFVRPEALEAMVKATEALRPRAFLEDVAVGTPYLGLPDESFPAGHPRRTSVHSITWVLAYDLVPKSSPVRVLYEWDALLEFLGEILERRPLYRMADPLGALNLTAMTEGHVQGWHFDSTDFVVSLALQASEGGGLFECAPFIRSESEENYDAVAGVISLRDRARVQVFPMVPGTLMVFQGRHSVHRVTPVEGARPRFVALFGYDTKPGTQSSDLLKKIRYGRTEPVPARD
jgi:hypothetical protein